MTIKNNPQTQLQSYPIRKDLKNFLKGQWALERTLMDFKVKENGQCKGKALFMEKGDILAYHEECHLQFGQYSGLAQQSYHFCFLTPSLAQVFFPDGRLFHELNLETGVCEVTHHCGQDVYQGTFTVLNSNQLHVTWRIKGPRKDQEIKSLYDKVA